MKPYCGSRACCKSKDFLFARFLLCRFKCPVQCPISLAVTMKGMMLHTCDVLLRMVCQP